MGVQPPGDPSTFACGARQAKAERGEKVCVNHKHESRAKRLKQQTEQAKWVLTVPGVGGVSSLGAGVLGITGFAPPASGSG